MTVVDFPIQNKIWDPAETLPSAQLRDLQLHRFRECVERASKISFYQEAFRAGGLSVDSIQGLEDVRRFPFTTKADMRQHYPLGMMAVPRESLARVHGSSGTTGKPTFVGYTRDDLETWAELCARFLVAGGLCPQHVVHVAFGYGLFTGGFGLHYGIEKVGAAVVPAASGNMLRQLMLMQDLRPDALVCTPSYALTIADAARKEGLDPRRFRLRYAYLGGEPWTEEMRTAIETEFDITAFDNYGLSEIIGPGVSGECRERQGMHVQEDHFIVECIDPESLEPVTDGELGELVFTSLSRQAMPIIRYRTRDIAALTRASCPCGRSGVRMSRIKGRSDDMLIIRGVNVFPSQIEAALLRVDGTATQYMIEVDKPGTLDEITIHVEVQANDVADRGGDTGGLRQRFRDSVYAIAGVRAEVIVAAPGTLRRSEGKATRVVDRRKQPHGLDLP